MTTTHDTAAAIIRTLIRAIDDQDYDTIAALLTPDVHFRLGNSDPTDLRSDFLDAAKTFRGTIADQRHTILNVWEADAETVVAAFDCYYRRFDGVELNLPRSGAGCLSTARTRQKTAAPARRVPPGWAPAGPAGGTFLPTARANPSLVRPVGSIRTVVRRFISSGIFGLPQSRPWEKLQSVVRIKPTATASRARWARLAMASRSPSQ